MHHLCVSSSAAYIKRVIAHPNFHNISFNQAEKMMETLDQGDLIIRPSSKGENHLTVTWKVRNGWKSHANLYGWTEKLDVSVCDVSQVADGIYQHVDVREEGKENAFSLGHTLWINNEVRRSSCLALGFTILQFTWRRFCVVAVLRC